MYTNMMTHDVTKIEIHAMAQLQGPDGVYSRHIKIMDTNGECLDLTLFSHSEEALQVLEIIDGN